MKGFRSGRSVDAGFVIAASYLAAHLPFLAPSLEDIDSINFALGLRDFDVASHQPHPPGSPVYIAFGRLSLALITFVAPSLDVVRAEALALSLWSALGGGVALAAAWTLFQSIDVSRRTATWATVLLGLSPLFWISGLRPMSDLPGLALALCAQALIVGGMADPRRLVAGAFVAGIAAGIRVQMIVLTGPLLALALLGERRPGGLRVVARSLAALGAGVLLWAVPLVVASGGVEGYLRALTTQAGEDFAWVDMLWANPTPRRLAWSLYETLVLPWSLVALAAAVGVAAVAGALHAIVRTRSALLLVAVAFGPYVAVHLLLQETFTVRYALPILPPVAWLAAHGALGAGRLGPVAALVMAGSAALVAVPAGVAYGRDAHPAFRAIADMEDRASGTRDVAAGPAAAPAAIYSHYSLRRSLQATAPAGIAVVEPRLGAEWLGLVDYWRGGGRNAVWFLADPRRTDLALIDPHAREPVRYRWDVGHRLELTGTRPLGADWYRFEPPGWFAGEGWALTPETGGVARSTGTGPDRQPVEAFVYRRDGPMHLMVGGGYVGAPREPVVFELSIDELPVDTWTLEAERDPRFLRFVDLPDGLPGGPGPGYARLTLAARAALPGRPTPAVEIRQFDIQPAEGMIAAFGEGWHEEEYDNVTGRRWRWTSGRSVIRVSPPQAVRLTLRGESAARYFDDIPRVGITAEGRTLATFHPDGDFVWEVVIPASHVVSAAGAIAIETDRVYVPAESEGTGDDRRLGLRLFEIDVHPVSP